MIGTNRKKKTKKRKTKRENDFYFYDKATSIIKRVEFAREFNHHHQHFHTEICQVNTGVVITIYLSSFDVFLLVSFKSQKTQSAG